jgi:hypothetical protein
MLGKILTGLYHRFAYRQIGSTMVKMKRGNGGRIVVMIVQTIGGRGVYGMWLKVETLGLSTSSTNCS